MTTSRSRSGLATLVLMTAAWLGLQAPAPVSAAPTSTATAAAPTAADPVIGAVGDMVCDPYLTEPRYDGSQPWACQHRAVADLAEAQGLAAFLPLGDLQYDIGTYDRFVQAYEPSFGRLRAISRPVPGNHEYGDEGARGYWDYFGAAAGPRDKGWYASSVGSWKLLALNTNCDDVDCSATSEQVAWLRAQLAAAPTTCTLAYFHNPRFTSSRRGSDPRIDPIWQALHAGGVDVVLNGHEHNYERFGLQDPAGRADPRGIRQFIVGTGGRGLNTMAAPIANSEVRNTTDFGLLRMTLRDDGYDWRFATTGGRDADSGSSACANTANGPVPPPAEDVRSTYRPLDPRRVLDTRDGTGAPARPVGPRGTLRLQVTGPPGSGLAPVGSTAVALNLTATRTTADSFASVLPTGADAPSTSSLNWVRGQTTANHVLTKVAPDGSVTLYNDQGSVDLVADLQGSYGGEAGGDSYRPLDPRRLVDTRSAGGTARIGAGGTLRLQVTGPAGSGLAPTGSTAVALNVTATGPDADGHLSVYPTGYAGGPSTSSVNFSVGQTRPNLVVSRVADDGSVTVRNDSGGVDVVVDLQGAHVPDTSGSVLRPLEPRRVLDTRTGTGAPQAPVGARGTVRLQVTGPAGSGLAPVGTRAVALNVTATGPTADGYASVFATGYADGPATSNLNWTRGDTVANLVVTRVADDGSVTLYNDAGSVDLVADLSGAFLPAAPATSAAARG